MKHGSLFTGIGGFDLGFERAGMQSAWQIENDKFCNRVLQAHFPEVQRYGDIREIKPSELEPVDVISAGFPCQDLSVAGRRAGLAGERSGLFWELIRILERTLPRWCVLENVPGLLSSNGGRDFALILSALAQCGYFVEWAVLDSQHFGVAQRRRRIFLIGHLGEPPARPVLLIPEGLRGHTAKGRKPGTDVAYSLDARSGGARAKEQQETFIAGSFEQNSMSGRGTLGWKEGSGSLRPVKPQGDHQMIVAQPVIGHQAKGGDPTMDNYVAGFTASASNTARGDNYREGSSAPVRPLSKPSIVTELTVRRLTPLECERLQGFPDAWTLLEDDPPDAPRYRALGNAVTVPVASWIATRIIETPKWPT